MRTLLLAFHLLLGFDPSLLYRLSAPILTCYFLGFDPSLREVFHPPIQWFPLGSTSLYYEGYRLSFSLSFQMPRKQTKRMAAPSATRKPSVNQLSTMPLLLTNTQKQVLPENSQVEVVLFTVNQRLLWGVGLNGSSQDVLPVLSSDILT